MNVVSIWCVYMSVRSLTNRSMVAALCVVALASTPTFNFLAFYGLSESLCILLVCLFMLFIVDHFQEGRQISLYVATFLMTLALIPVFGIYGAGVSTIVGYAVLAGLAGTLSQRQFPVPWQLARAALILGLAGTLATAALLGPDHFLWRIGCLAVYPIALFGLGVVRLDQGRALLAALRR